MHQKQTLKAGTRIQMLNRDMELAMIGKWTAANGPVKNQVTPGNVDWHIVVFADGGSLCVHRTGFRIVDNRADAVAQQTVGDDLRTMAEQQGIPMVSIWRAKEGLERAKKTRADAALARIMLRHGRLTPEARKYVSENYPQ